jgi:hypothetical protein
LLNEEVSSVFPETKTSSSSGLAFNMDTLTRSSRSSTAEPHYLNMSVG